MTTKIARTVVLLLLVGLLLITPAIGHAGAEYIDGTIVGSVINE